MEIDFVAENEKVTIHLISRRTVAAVEFSRFNVEHKRNGGGV